MKIWRYLLLMGCLSACHEPQKGTNVIDRLMPLGISIDSSELVPSDAFLVGQFTLIFAVPTGQPWQALPMQDLFGTFATQLTLAEPQVESYSGIDLVRIPASLRVETPEEDLEVVPYLGYAVRLVSGGVEKWVIGDLEVDQNFRLNPLPPDADVTFALPATASPNQSLSLFAQARGLAAGTYLVHWFVSDGALTRARSANVDWLLPGSGTQTVIAVMRVPGFQGISVRAEEITVSPY